MNGRMRRAARALATTALVAGAALTAPTAVLAAAGDLDTTFSGDGLATTNFGNRGGGINDIAIDSHGRIVAAGYGIYHGARHDVTLARYLPNGSPDLSFSSDGKLRTHFPFQNVAEAVAIDSQGRIVVAGEAGESLFFARFLPSGRFDHSFSGDGVCKVTFGNPSGATDQARATDIALDDEGRIVATGPDNAPADGLHFAVVRLNPNGSLDSSFGSNGKARFKVGSWGTANSLAIDSLGRIVVGGFATPQSGSTIRFAVARLVPNGTLDPSFSGDGRQLTLIGVAGEITSVAIDDRNRVVAAGNDYGRPDSFAVARYLTNGSLDPSFSGDGETVTPFAEDAHANSVALDPHGRIVAAGFTYHYPTDFALARYDPSGDLDTSFGDGGRVDMNLGGNDVFNAVAIDTQGRIVGGGARENEFAVVRYLGGP